MLHTVVAFNLDVCQDTILSVSWCCDVWRHSDIEEFVFRTPTWASSPCAWGGARVRQVFSSTRTCRTWSTCPRTCSVQASWFTTWKKARRTSETMTHLTTSKLVSCPNYRLTHLSLIPIIAHPFPFFLLQLHKYLNVDSVVVLRGDDVMADHCVLCHVNSEVTLRPSDGATVTVNELPVSGPTRLSQGTLIFSSIDRKNRSLNSTQFNSIQFNSICKRFFL